MPYDTIKGQKVTEVRKLQKRQTSKSISPAGMHLMKTLAVNYDTPKFSPDRFLTFLIVWRHVTFKVRLLREVDRQFSMGLIFWHKIHQIQYGRSCKEAYNALSDTQFIPTSRNFGPWHFAPRTLDYSTIPPLYVLIHRGLATVRVAASTRVLEYYSSSKLLE